MSICWLIGTDWLPYSPRFIANIKQSPKIRAPGLAHSAVWTNWAYWGAVLAQVGAACPVQIPVTPAVPGAVPGAVPACARCSWNATGRAGPRSQDRDQQSTTVLHGTQCTATPTLPHCGVTLHPNTTAEARKAPFHHLCQALLKSQEKY